MQVKRLLADSLFSYNLLEKNKGYASQAAQPLSVLYL